MSHQQNKNLQHFEGDSTHLSGTFTNQIVYVCAMLTNFQPALVPLPTVAGTSKSDVDDYFNCLSDDEPDSD